MDTVIEIFLFIVYVVMIVGGAWIAYSAYKTMTQKSQGYSIFEAFRNYNQAFAGFGLIMGLAVAGVGIYALVQVFVH